MGNVKGILDKLPAAVRHALFIFLGSLFAWTEIAARGLSTGQNPIVDAVVSSAALSAVGTATLWFTKLTKQYGRGAEVVAQDPLP